MVRLWLVLGLLACASSLSAQTTTVVNPTTVEFTPSLDHAATRLDGTPVVTSYELNAVGMNGTGAVALTVGLGKPAPNTAGLIILPVTQFATLTPNQVYTATVKAIGPDGVGVSSPSNPFGRSAPQVPAGPTNVKVR